MTRYKYQENNSGSCVVSSFKKRYQKPRVKHVAWQDEQHPGIPDMDHAVLIVEDAKIIRYSKQELLTIRELPASNVKPDIVDLIDVIPSIFDAEKWNLERKKSDTPADNINKTGENPDNRRRSADPRERIRKETDGIVLSPQRRSFNTGCFVPGRESVRTNRSHSPLGGKNDGGIMGMRDMQSLGTRRIGSGRIMRVPCPDYGDKNDQCDSDFVPSFSRGGSQQRGGGDDKYGGRGDEKYGEKYGRSEGKYGRGDDKYGRGVDDRYGRIDEKYERRSFGRDFDMNRGKDGRKNTRYSDRRRMGSENSREDEPEWFSGGPVSQNDTIELRGFDDADSIKQKRKLSPSRMRRAKEWSRKKSESQATNSDEKDKDPKDRAATPNAPKELMLSKDTDDILKPPQQKNVDKDTNNEKNSDTSTNLNNGESGAHNIDGQPLSFDDILKCDTIPGLLSEGFGGDGDTAATSRFSRWFKKDSPEKLSSRHSSIQEEHHIIKDLLKDINETSVSIPGDAESYFAPISPAANTGNDLGGNKHLGQSINIMEMLQRSKRMENNVKQPSMSGKILSLDELEAKFRQSVDMPQQQKVHQHQQQKPDEEMTAAFKKLLAQAQSVSAGPQNGPLPKPQAMSLLEMLSHSQQQDEAQARLAASTASQHHMMGHTAPSPNMPQQHHPMPMNDLTLKLQQAQFQKQQMDMLNKFINASMQQPTAAVNLRTSPIHDLALQHSRELLSRPEAQAILQALHQRIPSPRELQVHTQNILQRALIKKKLEEQTENYRKKQEMQRVASPNMQNTQAGPSKSVSSPTPLAFTPTSVLRKMTADKDDGKDNKMSNDASKPIGRPLTGMRPQQAPANQMQWNQQYSMKQPAGRPIVKANPNYPQMPPQTEQFFNQAAQLQQQRQYNNHPTLSMQQQQGGGANMPQQPNQQQRKPQQQYPIGTQMSTTSQAGQGVHQSYPNNPYPSNQSSFSQQLTQQQLRAQHQHRPTNTASGTTGQQQQAQSQQQAPATGNQHGQTQGSWQQFLSNAQQQQNNRSNGAQSSAGSLSPTTSNQLARWFSPDLLERARGGELPSTAGLAQHALSLEEIERQTAPPVHN